MFCLPFPNTNTIKQKELKFQRSLYQFTKGAQYNKIC